MKCPIDEVDLVLAERQGIEIDYCPKCRGVWLDRGELDKIIERSEREDGGRGEFARGENRDRDYDDRPDPRSQPRKRKGGFLGDLFEFGG